MKQEEKHFLDTSILLPLLVASSQYKKYLLEQINNKAAYVSKYVQMEMRRSLITTLIDFYMLLECPSTRDLADAQRLWTHRFSKRELGTLISFMAYAQDKQEFFRSKEDALKYLASYIRRADVFIRKKFKDPGNDSIHCPKPEIVIEVEDLNSTESITQGLREFIEEFDAHKGSESFDPLPRALAVGVGQRRKDNSSRQRLLPRFGLLNRTFPS